MMRAMLAVLILLTGCELRPVSENEVEWFVSRCKEAGGVPVIIYYEKSKFVGEVQDMRCAGLNADKQP